MADPIPIPTQNKLSMSDSRRSRIRDQLSTRDPQRIRQKVRSRNGSIGVSNEDSTDGDENTVTCSLKKGGRKSAPAKDEGKGLRTFRRRKRHSSSLAERDVIDGFLILSFASYQDLEVSVESFCLSKNNVAWVLHVKILFLFVSSTRKNIGRKN